MADYVCGTGIWGTAPLPGDPGNASGLTATPAFGGIDVEWSYPTSIPEGVAHTILYRSTNSDFITAVQHKVVTGNFFYDKINNDSSTVYYYWIKVVSVNGTVGDLVGPAWSTARPLIADLIEQLTSKIDQGLLAQSLKDEIARLDTITALVNTEIGNRLLAMESLENVFTALERDTLGTLNDFNERINGLLDADALFVDELNDITTTLDNADIRIEEVRELLTSEGVRLDARADQIESDLNAAQQSLSLRDQELTEALESNVNQFTAFKKVVETENSLTANRVDGILARIGDNEAAIGNMQRIQLETDLIEALQFDYIKAETTNRVAAFRTQELVRVTAEEALAQRIDEQVARVNDNVAEISSLSTTMSNSTSALASRISELSAKLDATPTFASGWELGADYDQWIVRPGNTMTPVATSAYSGSQSALMESTQTSPSSGSWTDGVYANIPEGTTTAFKGFEVTIRLWAKKPSSNAASQAAVAYSTKDAGNSGWFYMDLTDDWQQFEFSYSVPAGSGTVNHVLGIWGDTSGSGKGTLVDGLTVTQTASELSDVSAAIEAQQEALVNLEEAVATDFQSVESRFNGVEADIQTEATTRANELESVAQLIQDLDSSLGQAQASLTTLEQTQTSQNNALASRASSLESRVGDAESNISTLEESTSTLESSLATSTQQLQSQINGNKSSITTEASTRSTAIDNTVGLITALRGEYEGTAGLVANHSTLIQNNEDTIAQNVTAVQAARDDAEALVASEEEARINAIAAQASRTDGVITRMGSAESNISSLTTGLSDANQALSTYQSTVSSEFDDVRGTLNREVTSLSEADSAMVERVDGLTATVGDLDSGTTAGMLAESQVRAERDSALASTSNELAVRLDDAEAALITESRINAEKEFIEAIQFDAIEVSKAGATAGLQTETEIRIQDGEAFASQLSTIGAQVNDNMATVVQYYETKADATTARAQMSSGIYSRLDAADAAIISEQTTRTTSVSQLNQAITNETLARADELNAEAQARADAISAEASARDDAIAAEASSRDSAINSAKTSLQSSINTEKNNRINAISDVIESLTLETTQRKAQDTALTSSITTERNTRQDAINSLSTDISQLSSSVGATTSLIQSQLTAETEGKSMVTNGSFVTGDFLGWGGSQRLLMKDQDKNGTDLYKDCPAPHFVTFNDPDNYGKDRHVTNEYFNVTPGDTYAFSMWYARVSSGDGLLKVSVQWKAIEHVNANGILGWPNVFTLNLDNKYSNDWHFTGNKSIVVPEGAVQGRIVVTADDSNTKGTMAFTNLRAGRVDAALTEKIDSVQAYAGDLVAALESSMTAELAEKDGQIAANASAINNVQTSTANNLAAYKQTVATQVEEINGELTSIGALYTAQVQTNGLIGGFGIYNDGTTVEAGFDVDRFWIGRTNANKRKPFIIENDEVFIDEAVIRSLTFSKLRDEAGTLIVENGKLKADYINAGTLNVAGAAKFTGDVQSSNFVNEQSGWRIKQNGEIQINSNSSGGRVVQDVNGIRVYDGGGTLRVRLGKL